MKTSCIIGGVACCLASGGAFANIQFTNVLRYTSLESENLRTGNRLILNSETNTATQGLWESLLGNRSGGFSYHRSDVGPNFIDVRMEVNQQRSTDPQTGDAVLIYGSGFFSAEFIVTQTVVSPRYIPAGRDTIYLGRVLPDFASWSLDGDGTLPDLPPGSYQLIAGNVNTGSSGVTLYLPSPGSLTLLIPLTLCAHRRRR
jgi:hypothetical protein